MHHTPVSDHDPILMQLVETTISRKQFRFRFENTWLKEPCFKDEVSVFWRSVLATHILPKLLSISAFMAKWGRTFFHKFRDKVKHQKKVVSNLVNRENEMGINPYFEERKRLHELLLHEEVYWKQRAKTFWLQEGDSNSRYFHAHASQRKKLNRIPYLEKEEGLKVDEENEMKLLVKDYFSSVFTESGRGALSEESMNQNIISASQNERLTASLTFEEFTVAVKQIHPDKASGPNGFSPAFVQYFWELVGLEVFKCCREWIKNNMFPVDLNDTNLILISKKDNVEKLTDVRPIALCNVLTKSWQKCLQTA
ncbi:hypothetical protein AgCh_025820 [Apium graveolens]